RRCASRDARRDRTIRARIPRYLLPRCARAMRARPHRRWLQVRRAPHSARTADALRAEPALRRVTSGMSIEPPESLPLEALPHKIEPAACERPATAAAAAA